MDPSKTRLKFELEQARLHLQLQKIEWTDERLAQIPDESLAALAYSLSVPLQVEFGKSQNAFVAYWRSLRN